MKGRESISRRASPGTASRLSPGLRKLSSLVSDQLPEQRPLHLSLSAAPLHGFASAADYYRESSSLPYLARIEIPTLCISAADDPIIPGESAERARQMASPNVTFVLTHGGKVYNEVTADVTLGTAFEFDFNIAGTTSVALKLPAVTIIAGHTYSIYVVGLPATPQGVVAKDD